ncbi:MAG: hypothetical protein BGO55_31550 [Sphingobacteriales bacterium 50-39]|nr:RagB/SusD family nutrient uptake outer membrane protein [Sphingobacteriales bacterium]OJW61038.1 MAG: hypothetical protein BGO55_31550 [Sphingobacteriales bacterium 50-39]
MKKHALASIIVICYLISGCKKELIEDPLSTIAPTNFYKTQTDFETATNGVIGIHAGMDLYSWGWHYMQTWPAGDYKRGPGDPWENLSYAGDWYFSESVWTADYKQINNINLVLSKIDGVSFDESRKNALKGELLFLRAVAYFDLVRAFGKVPIHLTPTVSIENASLPEGEIKDVYAVVIKDLQDASGLLPLKNPYGPNYANQGAAVGLLAKVYITMAGHPLLDQTKWQAAIGQLEKIVDPANPSQSVQPYTYHLEPDYQNLFDLVVSPAYSGSGGTAKPVIGKPADKNGPEGVYEINYSTVAGLLSAAFPTSVSGLQCNDWLVNFFDPGDYRKEVTMVTKNNDPLGVMNLEKKFQSTGTTWNDNQNNWPYLRYANLILYLAEAENEVNGPTPLAFRCINAIRARARAADGTARAVPADYVAADATTADQFRALVYRERILEFSCEGEDWFDWIRTGTLKEEITFQGRTQYYTDRLNFFPKPQAEITLAKGNLTQNTGY